MNERKNTGAIIGSIIVLILLLLGAWMVFSDRTGNPESTNDTSGPATNDEVTNLENEANSMEIESASSLDAAVQ